MYTSSPLRSSLHPRDADGVTVTEALLGKFPFIYQTLLASSQCCSGLLKEEGEDGKEGMLEIATILCPFMQSCSSLGWLAAGW